LAQLAALALALEHLGVPRDTDSLQGRVKLQKAIFLAQQAGVSFEYSFGWYSEHLAYEHFEFAPRLFSESSNVARMVNRRGSITLSFASYQHKGESHDRADEETNGNIARAV
jgi:uncharacterized protein YwgA